MVYFENLVRLPEIETAFLFIQIWILPKALTFSYNVVDASSTPSVKILETFKAYQYRIIVN